MTDPDNEEKDSSDGITDFDHVDYEEELERMFPNEDEREDFVTQNM